VISYGGREAMCIVVRDITERKRTEETLRRSEGGLAAAQRIARLGNFDYEVERDVARWSDELYRIFGFSPQQFVPTYKSFLGSVHPDDRRSIRRAVREALYEGRQDSIEYRILRPNGDARVVHTRFEVVRGETGGPIGLVGTVQDVTERKQAEEEIRELNEQLEQRVRRRTAQLEAFNRELESFSYSVSHDLRAPLRSIDGFSQILLEDYAEDLDEAGRDYLARVRAASQRMGRLIDDLLDLSRMTRSEMRRERVDLSALVEGFAEELKRAQPERRVEFVVEGGLVVEGDGTLLRVALENLLRNAWKFTGKQPRARIEFGVTSARAPEPTSCATTGRGSTRLTPTSCSAPSSACTGRASSRVRA
jgi:PAS domain S-box-containing protein